MANPVTRSLDPTVETSMKRMPAKPSPEAWWTEHVPNDELASVSRMKMACIVSTFVISPSRVSTGRRCGRGPDDPIGGGEFPLALDANRGHEGCGTSRVEGVGRP